MPNADDLKATLGTTLKKSVKYRKYVWNDFSIVEKARIQILESGNFGTVPLNEDEFNLVDDLTVQINPEKFEYTHSIKPSSPLIEVGTPHQGVYDLHLCPKNVHWVFHDFYSIYMMNTTLEHSTAQ